MSTADPYRRPYRRERRGILSRIVGAFASLAIGALALVGLLVALAIVALIVLL